MHLQPRPNGPRCPTAPDGAPCGTADDQAYCIFCRFHPCQESGAPASGTATVLRPGDRVLVGPGGVRDAWGNTNGLASPELLVPSRR